MYKYFLSGFDLDQETAELIAGRVRAETLQQGTYGYRFSLSEKLTTDETVGIGEDYECDILNLPLEFNPDDVKLVISDMDSTFIAIECIDEIADFAGKKTEVSQVTERAMRGELDFAASLTARVSLLADLPASVLDQVYEQRLTLNPGAHELVQQLKKHQIKFALVSGGFTSFTKRLETEFELDYTRANKLEISNNKLTGKVLGDIIGAEAKQAYLLELCRQLNISPQQTIALGDGANDLKMMQQAGLSVAYRAKPTVQQQANCALNHSGLDAVLNLLSL
ncbi:MAG: phosphoserine phosphatase SerB [Gammaproteobacteria bacterium]|nr:phosphoserine phosphatase SerB [Gammaproteobacteria bacterium]